MEKAIERQRVLLEHLRPSSSSSHSFEGSLSVSFPLSLSLSKEIYRYLYACSRSWFLDFLILSFDCELWFEIKFDWLIDWDLITVPFFCNESGICLRGWRQCCVPEDLSLWRWCCHRRVRPSPLCSSSLSLW